MNSVELKNFVMESNRIEGIFREPTYPEIRATSDFVALSTLTVSDVIDLVTAFQPGARPRFVADMNVRVGRHIPPAGGPQIQQHLVDLVQDAVAGRDAYHVHVDYETLHPFTDGNGRSGRALWLWQMKGKAPLGFLHTFYYQALGASRPPA